jgi:hypothetical protein
MYVLKGFMQACVRMNFTVSDKIEKIIWEHFEHQEENQNFLYMTNGLMVVII